MPQSLNALRTYTNADVARASQPKLGVRQDTGTKDRPRYRPDPQELGPSIEELLLEAQGSLDRADAMGDQSDLLGVPQALLSLQAEQEAARPASLRDITEGVSRVGGYAGLASIVPGPQSPVLAGAATALMAPNALRHLIAPQEDETRLGGLAEAGMALGPSALSKGYRAIKSARAAKNAIQVPPSLGMSWGRAAGPKPATLADELYGGANSPQNFRSADALVDEAGITQGADIYAMPRTARSGTPASRTVVGAGDAPQDIEAFQPALFDAPQEVKPSLGALRHTMGRAARDLKGGSPERRVNLEGKLPEGMTERRMDELVAKYGGSAPSGPREYSRTDNPLAPAEVSPLNYTKSGYIQRPGDPRTHRRGWNAKQVEEARQRALMALKGLDLFQSVK